MTSDAYPSASSATTVQAVRDALRDALALGTRDDSAATSGVPAGFSEAQSVFASETLDDARFNESVRLARAFASIVDPGDRRLVLALVAILANAESA